MHFSREHLTGNYKWTVEAGDSLLTGSPTRRLFDRWNGVQVLFIINCLAASSNSFSIEEGRKIESLINDYLPLESRSEKSVYSWLQSELNAVAV
jgi:hypothetical protein